MREIEFRGYDTQKAKWVYGSLVNNLWTVAIDNEIICEIITTENDYDCWESLEDVENICRVALKSVGQYTGLKDKNRKKIYEGDIIKEITTYPIGGLTLKFEITYDEGAFFLGDQYILHLHRQEDIEIIGNIHENPEMLKS